MEPQKTEADDNSNPAPNPIDEVELPQVEQPVISNPRSPKQAFILVLSLLILLGGALAAYLLLKKV